MIYVKLTKGEIVENSVEKTVELDGYLKMGDASMKEITIREISNVVGALCNCICLSEHPKYRNCKDVRQLGTVDNKGTCAALCDKLPMGEMAGCY